MTVPPRTGREGAGYLPRFAECATYRSRGSAGGAGENKMCALPEPFEKPEKKQSPTESPHFFLFHSLLCCCRPLCVCVVETHGFLKARGNREVGVGTGGGESPGGERGSVRTMPPRPFHFPTHRRALPFPTHVPGRSRTAGRELAAVATTELPAFLDSPGCLSQPQFPPR